MRAERRYSVIVWDWNGTLLDDVDENIEIVNEVLRIRGLAPLSKEGYKAAFRMPVRDFYASVGVDLSLHTFESVARDYNALYRARFASMRLTPGAEDILAYASSRGVAQFILSASEKSTLVEQVRMKGIERFFSEIVGNDDHSVAGKVDKGRELASRLDPRARILFVGDLDHDYEVSRVMGADCALYRHGHQAHRAEAAGSVGSVESAKTAGYRVVDSLADLRDLL